tara:strand:+ start:4886 stop:5605 length:720 start_codon:yes stop_codon:yes gene_type:complete
MIYQCYFQKAQKPTLFSYEPYKGFGLEVSVNKKLFLNCPELSEHTARTQLTEYAAFLWHWRNDYLNPDDWIGFTSYRQLDKFKHIFETKDQVTELLKDNKVVGWGQYQLHGKDGRDIPLSEQATICHPGLNEYIEDVFSRFGHTVPPEWYTKNTAFFANYWAMPVELFSDFMEFSWPMVEWSLENITDSEFYKNQPEYGTVSNDKAIGYFMERLFILWYLSRNLSPYNPSKPQALYHNG